MYVNFMSNAIQIQPYFLGVHQFSTCELLAGSVMIIIRRLYVCSNTGSKRKRDHWKEVVGGADLAAGE